MTPGAPYCALYDPWRAFKLAIKARWRYRKNQNGNDS